MNSKKVATIYGINGPVIYLKGKTGFKMSEMVHVGPQRLVGEVISLDKDRTTVQVYEETSGLTSGGDGGSHRGGHLCDAGAWNPE